MRVNVNGSRSIYATTPLETTHLHHEPDSTWTSESDKATTYTNWFPVDRLSSAA
ncbi:MAG: hypothetical protein VB140_03230 [Burkholderia sp.]